jgi:protein CpxP
MDVHEEGKQGQGRALRRGVLYGLLGSAVLAAAFAARPIAAAAQSGGWHRFGGRFGHHGGNPEAMRDHVQVAVKWALREVDASEDQQKKVGDILTGAVDELLRLKDRHRANREAFAAGLAGATVDRAAVEQARQAEMAVAEEASRRLAQALADAAEVLTPQQRQELLERAHRHHR